MLTVTYKERTFLDKYRCVDKIKKVNVIKKDFVQGELTYFKKDAFAHFVIETSSIVDCVEV